MAERMTLTREKSFKVTQLFGGNHRGVDLNINPRGIAKPPILLPEKAVRAVVDVVDNGKIEPTYGNWIQLTMLDGEFKGWWMRACHMLQLPNLKKGSIVMAGEEIGYQGNTGRSSGAHVHFELGVPCKEFIPWKTSYLRAPYGFLGCPQKTGTYPNIYDAIANKPNVPSTSGSTAPVASTGVKKGDCVQVIAGTKDYNGRSLALEVYRRNYFVQDVSGDRAVIGPAVTGAVTAAVHTKNLKKV